MVAALAVASVTPASAALWHENYDSALRAMRAEEWDQAVGYLEQSIQQRPDSCIGCKTYGMNFIDYVPYLKQGICHYQLGNHDAALTLFQQEEMKMNEDNKTPRSNKRKGQVSSATPNGVASADNKIPRFAESWIEPITGMEFIWVQGGTYQMGCGDWDGLGDDAARRGCGGPHCVGGRASGDFRSGDVSARA